MIDADLEENGSRGRGTPIVPVVESGVLICGDQAVSVHCATGQAFDLLQIGATGRWLITPCPERDFTVAGDDMPPLAIRVGRYEGRVRHRDGARITGWARDRQSPNDDVAVIAFSDNQVVAVATARAEDHNRFAMILPHHVAFAQQPQAITLGVAGSDCVLDCGHLTVMPSGPPDVATRPILYPRALADLAIRIKVTTPDLGVAAMWGDYHFARSLAQSFQELGLQANVDTADNWYAQREQEDVVLSIRGKHRVKVDRSKINILWVISHPEYIPAEEYEDYDAVFISSEFYARKLQADGIANVEPLLQATDANRFGPRLEANREQACLFVANSRQEFRAMVKWSLEKRIPLALFGGGWQGIVPPDVLRGTAIENAKLPEFYARHMLLLNDHWDSMRDNGFLSNRLFDGSAAGTPIISDPVLGLADVFGDTVSQVRDADEFEKTVLDCFNNPDVYLEKARRAREIVLSAHTFDHRARTFMDAIERISACQRLFV